jgi:nickel/cobalt transporter (NicO) family protein
MSRFAHRVAALAVLAAILMAAGATRAAAHPLGNFTVNTYSGLRVGSDRLEVDYVLDMAEIPTFQARQAVDTDHDGTVTPPRPLPGATASAPASPATCGPRPTGGRCPLASPGRRSASPRAPPASRPSGWSAP